MAIQTIPGLTGFTYARVASMDKRAVGKLTDANHLESFHSTEPADYDKKISSPFPNGSLLGASFHKDNKTVFLSGGDKGTVIAYDCELLKVVSTYQLDVKFKDSLYQDSFTSDLIYNAEKNELVWYRWG